MTIGSILLSISLFIVVLGFLARPFFISPTVKNKGSSRLELLAQKDHILAEIQALDFEFETGTITEQAYQQQRYLLMKEAALLLRNFNVSLQEKHLNNLDDKLEDKIEAAIAKIRGLEDATSGQPCPECNAVTKSSDKFCANCGHKLSSTTKATSQ